MDGKIRTEAADRTQDLYRAIHDPVIRGRMDFTGRLDAAALQRAVHLSIHAVPQLACRFDGRSHEWKPRRASADEIVRVVPDGGPDSAPDALLLSPIDFEQGPQLRLFLIRGAAGDSLCLLMSHLVADGGGYKRYLSLLAQLYSHCLQDSTYAAEPPAGDRGLGQVLRGYSPGERWSVPSARMKPLAEDPAMFLPLAGDPDRSSVATCSLEKEEFAGIRAYGRERNASVNDLLMTAFARVLSARTGCTGIAFPCPVDVHRYLKHPEACGICNLSSSYVCRLTVQTDDPFEKTLQAVSAQMSAQKDSPACVKALVLLNAVSHAVPYPVFRWVFHRFFTIPVVSFTNFGVLEEEQLSFQGAEIHDMYLAGAVKSAPYFQVSVSTWRGRCTMSSCFHGTSADQGLITGFLEGMRGELLTAAAVPA